MQSRATPWIRIGRSNDLKHLQNIEPNAGARDRLLHRADLSFQLEQTMTKATPKSLETGFGSLTFAGNRTPESQDIDAAFCQLSAYRDGAIFLGHWAGLSAWERHTQGDELVMVIDGSTTLTMLLSGEEVSHLLSAGQLIVVPQDTWHRFETPAEVKLMTVTPQPTDHCIDVPS